MGNLAFGRWGIDLTTRDLATRPGDDFDRYAGGAWADRTSIPADSAYAGVYDDLERLSQRRLAAIVADSGPETAVGALYRSYMDETATERVGARPLEPGLSALARTSDLGALAMQLGRMAGGFGLQPFELGTGPALDDPKLLRFDVSQGGLGLPDRDYYLLDRFAPQRVAYRTYVERIFTLVGSPSPATEADAVLAFETELARTHYARADARDPAKSLRSATLGDLQREAPGFPWADWLREAGYPTDPATPMVMVTDGALKAGATLWSRTPVPTLRSWAEFHLADDAAPFLSSAFVDARFALERELKGLKEPPTRDRRGLLLVDNLLGDEVGQDYVHRFFSPQDRAAAGKVVADVKAALRRRVAANDWLTPATRETALRKLDRTDVMLGFPERWRDHPGLRLSPNNLFGNVAQIRAADWARQRAELDQPLDRRFWIIHPQTVNAYNGGQELKIVLPAARLQPPLFGRLADPAVNYGALGALAGHELSHSFDNRGRLVDPEGRLRDWWTPADTSAFEARTTVLGAQYAVFEALPGLHLNPKLTMGENIADLVGVLAALDAYHASLGGNPAPVLDGLTGDQRFFLAYAQSRREKQREADLRDQVSRDAHAPGRFRVIGPLRNVDAWYQAFQVRPGDRWYLPTAERARIW